MACTVQELIRNSHMETTQMKTTEFVKAGTVCVDSGQILLIDPCYIKESFSNGVGSRDLNYDRVCRVTLRDAGCGEVGGLAFATSSGHGDGVYPVYVARAGGRIASVRIDFIEEGGAA